MPKTTQILAIGIFVLLLGIGLPTYITSTNTANTVGVELSEGGTNEITDSLKVTPTTVNSSNVTVEVQETDTFQSKSKTGFIGEQLNYTISGEDVNVTIDSVHTQPTLNRSVLLVEYPPTFAWDGGTKTIADNLGLLLAAVTLIIGVGAIVVVIE